MSDTIDVKGIDVPLTVFEALLEKFDRSKVEEGSGAGVTEKSGDGYVFALVDDGDNDSCVRVENLSGGTRSRYTYVSELEELLEREQEPETEILEFQTGRQDSGARMPANGTFTITSNHSSSPRKPFTVWFDGDESPSRRGWGASAEPDNPDPETYTRGWNFKDVVVVDE